MKRFNLEEYLKNPERKVVRKDGKDVRIICTDAKREYYPVIALVDVGCYETPVCYTKNGECFLGQENYCDLFFAPEKKEGWVNLYRGNLDWTCAGSVHNSKDEAEKHIDDREHYITTIKIEWEE